MVNTFFKKNVLSFHNHNVSYLNFDIPVLIFIKPYMIDLDLIILNPHVFNQLYSLELNGVIRKIETDVFKPFKNLKFVFFNYEFSKQLFETQGIEWIKSINSEIRIDLSIVVNEVRAFS